MGLVVVARSSSNTWRADMRIAAEVSDGMVVNVLVLADGAQGDETLAGIAGLVEVTGVDPQPGIGWSFDGSSFAPPPSED